MLRAREHLSLETFQELCCEFQSVCTGHYHAKEQSFPSTVNNASQQTAFKFLPLLHSDHLSLLTCMML